MNTKYQLEYELRNGDFMSPGDIETSIVGSSESQNQVDDFDWFSNAELEQLTGSLVLFA